MGAEEHEGFALYAQEHARLKVINETIARGDSAVQQFYDGAVVFITGGTGFLGKQLVEKLFRSCKIKKLYYVLRARKEKPIQTRVQEVLKDSLYDYLHETQPDFVSKITPVEGDITKIGLGIDPKLWDSIIEEVNVIIHSAATINFMDPLKVATMTNVRATREMVGLAKACKNLRAFVHISTAYVQSTVERSNDWVMEKFYETPISPELLIKLAEELDEEEMDAMTPQLTDKWPNTYTFTKLLAEEVVRTMAADLPVCIVRPAIVLASLREPPGWLDKSNVNGPVGFIMGACLGALHAIFGDVNVHFDMVPVDLVNNAIIVAAQETAARNARGEHDIKIYTVSSTRNNGPSIGELRYFCENSCRALPTPKLLWYGYCIITKNSFVFALLTWVLQYIPAYIADFFLLLSGKKPRAFKLLSKAYKQNKIYSHFMMHQWNFGDSNLVELRNKLSPTDRIIYEIDTSTMDQSEHLFMNLFGVRKYLLKDGLKDTDYALKKQSLLKIANVIFLIAYVYVVWKIVTTFYYISSSFFRTMEQNY